MGGLSAAPCILYKVLVTYVDKVRLVTSSIQDRLRYTVDAVMRTNVVMVRLGTRASHLKVETKVPHYLVIILLL